MQVSDRPDAGTQEPVAPEYVLRPASTARSYAIKTRNGWVDIYENPGTYKVLDLLRRARGSDLRGCVMDGAVFMFDAYLTTHFEVGYELVRQCGVDQDFVFYPTGFVIRENGTVESSPMSEGDPFLNAHLRRIRDFLDTPDARKRLGPPMRSPQPQEPPSTASREQAAEEEVSVPPPPRP